MHIIPEFKGSFLLRLQWNYKPVLSECLSAYPLRKPFKHTCLPKHFEQICLIDRVSSGRIFRIID